MALYGFGPDDLALPATEQLDLTEILALTLRAEELAVRAAARVGQSRRVQALDVQPHRTPSWSSAPRLATV